MWMWITWVLAIPLIVLAGGIALLATDIGGLPFDNPDLWWLAAVVPFAGLIYVYGMTRRRRSIARFTSAQLASLIVVRMSPGPQAFRAGLTVLAIVMLVAAILGPRWGIQMEKQKVHGVDIVIAVDVSRSMLARDVEPSRLERAKQEIKRQLTERAAFQRSHRLALLAFAGTTSLKVPLTTDCLAFRSNLANLSMYSAARGGTAIARAIHAAADLFAKSPPEASKIILLFTDGEALEGNPIEAAQDVYEGHGIRVFTVGVGEPALTVGALVPASDTEDGEPVLYDGQIVFSKLHVAGLKEMAEAGRGEYASVQDFHVLVDAISRMRREELSTAERLRHKPRYQWFIAMALLLLGLETMMNDHSKNDVGLPRRLRQVEAS